MIALQTAQKLRVVNGDKTSHNIHPLPNNNSEWNKSQPAGVPPFEKLGTLTQKVTVAAGETKTLQFVFKVRPGV